MPSQMQSEPGVNIVAQTRDIVGESPVWCAEEESIYWVDVIGCAIRKVSIKSGEIVSWPTEGFPTAITLRQDEPGALVSFADGLFFFDFATGHRTAFASPEADVEGNRLNEGKADPSGRFWVGSMQTNLNPDGSMREMDAHNGALYSVTPGGAVERHSAFEFGISNTMAWDLERGRYYFGDTLEHTIYAYDYDDGRISNKRVFAHTPEYGFPDGSCIDAEGFLWNCRYAGGCLIRYSPDGAIDRIVRLPASNITACAFGGPGLETLYITTALNGLSESEKAANTAQGSLLAFDPGVRGAPEFRFGG